VAKEKARERVSKMPKGEKKAGGRPKTIKRYSEAVKKNWLAAAAKIAKETGMKVEEHLLRMLIDPATQDTARIGIGKLYNDALLVKESEQTINDNRTGPMIGLPPIASKPKAVPVEKDQEEVRVH
jgi:hypothetical protein